MQNLRNNLGRIGLQRFFKGLNMQLPTFLRLYGNMFILQNGQVPVKNYQSAPVETREERITRMMEEDAQRDREAVRRREEQKTKRLGGLRTAYASRPG